MKRRKEILIEKYIQPSEIKHIEDGFYSCTTKIWHNNYGEKHSYFDLPALINYKMDLSEEHGWFRDGILHRENKPAVVVYDFLGRKYSEIWYFNGKMYKNPNL
jgi:uncharacterized protein YodC (DUF2158 family)